MNKIYLLLFSCLLFFSKGFAQTDSTPPPVTAPVQDTTHTVVRVHKADSGTYHLSHQDSLRRDSLRHHRAMIRDSLLRDSVARHQAAATQDSLPRIPAAPPVVQPQPPPAPPKEKGPDALTFWQKVLRANP